MKMNHNHSAETIRRGPARSALLLLTLAALVGGQGSSAQPLVANDQAAWTALTDLEYRRESEVQVFAPYLAHEEAGVRYRAALAVARATPADAASYVTPLLADGNVEVRQMAAFALGQLADATAVSTLLDATRDSEPRVREEALYALGKIGGEQTAEPLATFLQHPAAELRGAAALSLARMADSTQTARLLAQLAIEEEPQVEWKLLRACESAATLADAPTAVMPHLAARSPAVRAAAARALGRLGDERAVRPLMRVLVDREWRVRVQGSRALGAIGSPAATEALLSLLADPVPHVRETAAQALGRLGAAAIPGLTAALDDEALGVRRAAIEALAKITPDEELGPALAERLRAYLDDSSPVLAGAAIGALAAHEGTDIFDLLSEHTLIGHPPAVRLAAIDALAELGEPAALGALVELLDDDDWVVTLTAADGLGRLGDDAAVSSLLDAYEGRTGFAEFDVRLAIVDALGRVGNHRCRPLLLEAALDRDPRLREFALAALDSVAGRAGADSAAAWAYPDSVIAAGPPASGGARLGDPPADFPLTTSPPRTARLVTARGTITIELWGDRAPNTVASFVRLARSGYYANGVFHRVVPDFVIQGGCPRHDGWGGPAYALRSEWNPLRYGVGYVGMAHAGKDTAGSQFFITHSPQPHLDGRYTIFGRVLSGMQVVDAIQQGDIFSIRVVEP